MMAHIRQLASGHWQARVYVGQDRSPLIKTWPTEAEAKAWAADEELKRQKGTLTEPCKDTLAVYGRKWLDDATTKDRIRGSTWRGYSRTFRTYIEDPPAGAPLIGRKRMDALTPEHIKALYTWLRREGRRQPRGKDPGLSKQTVGGLHAVLRQILYAAFDSGAIEVNLAAKLRRAAPRTKTRRGKKALTKDELDRFFAAARTVRRGEDDTRLPDRYCGFWHLVAATGMRPGEALALTWEDLDLDGRTLRIRRSLSWVRGERRYEITEPKTAGSTRVVALPSNVIPMLDAHRVAQLKERMKAGPKWADLGLVFTTESGNLRGHWNRIMREAGLGTFEERPAKPKGQSGPRKQGKFTPLLPPYCLRHTHATLQLRAGVPVKVISERLGHASTAFTMDVYADALPDMQGAAADAWDAMFAEGTG
jgi:integrase